MGSKQIKMFFSFAILLAIVGQIMSVTAFAAEEENSSSASTVSYSGTNSNHGPEIVEELAALRTENEKHFRMSDGSYAVMQYMNAVHYKDSDGNWKDIRNTLSSGTYRGQSAYTLQAGNVSKAFTASVESAFVFCVERFDCALELCPYGKSIKFEPADNDYDIEVGEPGVNQITETGTKVGAVSALAYQDILPGAKLYFSNAGFDTTESIIISERQDSYIYCFDLNLAELSANRAEDGSLYFINPYGELIFKIHAPYLVDYAGAVCEKAEYSVTEQDGRLTLTITADRDWMNQPNRIYPVTLSSLIECSPDTVDSAGKATHVAQGTPGAGRGSGEELYLGYSCSDEVIELRVYISTENFPSLPDQAEIIGAQISFCQTSYSDVLCEEACIGLYSTDSFRGADANKERLRNLTWEGRPISRKKLAETVCGKDTTDKSLAWDITDFACEWYKSGDTAQTFVLQLENCQDYSKTHAMVITLKGSRALDVPLLTVRYTAETVEESTSEEGRLNRDIDSNYQIGVGITYTEEGEISRIFEFTQQTGTEAPVPGEIIVFEEVLTKPAKNMSEENNDSATSPV